MHGPAVVSWLLVVVCGGTGAYCLTRVRHGTGGRRHTARIEAVMGLGMAVMALPASVPLPLPPPGFYAVLFGAVAAYALQGVWWERPWRAAPGGYPERAGHTDNAGHVGHVGHKGSVALCGHHAVEALAMVYMALVMGASSGGAAHGPHAAHGAEAGGAEAGGVPLLTAALLLHLTVRVLRAGPLIASGGTAPHDPGAPPGLPDACRLTLSLGTLTMLLAL